MRGLGTPLSTSSCDVCYACLIDQFAFTENQQVQFVEVKGDSCSVSCSTHAFELLHPDYVTLYPLQLSCSSSSPELKNRVRFRRYFQLLPTDLDLVPGFFGTMQYYGWKQVVIVQQEENLFSQVSYYYMVSLFVSA